MPQVLAVKSTGTRKDVLVLFPASHTGRQLAEHIYDAIKTYDLETSISHLSAFCQRVMLNL